MSKYFWRIFGKKQNLGEEKFLKKIWKIVGKNCLSVKKNSFNKYRHLTEFGHRYFYRKGKNPWGCFLYVVFYMLFSCFELLEKMCWKKIRSDMIILSLCALSYLTVSPVFGVNAANTSHTKTYHVIFLFYLMETFAVCKLSIFLGAKFRFI